MRGEPWESRARRYAAERKRDRATQASLLGKPGWGRWCHETTSSSIKNVHTRTRFAIACTAQVLQNTLSAVMFRTFHWLDDL